MDAALLSLNDPLPDDVPTLQALVRDLVLERDHLRAENARRRDEIGRLRSDVERLGAEVEALTARLNAALKHRFGRRSERQPRPAPVPGQPRRKARPHGRGPLPEHLPRKVVLHDLTEEEKRCPCCGQARACIGEEATEQLEVIPAQFFVLRTVKRKYACRRCDPAAVPVEQRFRVAGPEQVGPIAKGLCGPGLLAHVVTAKYADHVPLNRLAQQLGRAGVRIARSTLGDWVQGAADLLRPLVGLMHKRLLQSRVLSSDDTPVKLRVAGQGKTDKAHLWVYLGDADYPYVVFDFTADYTAAAGPEVFLKGYKGYLEADALAQYEGLYGPGGVLHCCCWAHARRKFVEARDGGDERAAGALELIGRLYAVERQLPPLLLPSDEPGAQAARLQREQQRRQLRQGSARPVLEALKGWLEANRKAALPRTKLGEAIGYAQNNWEALARYVEEGYLPIDNNRSERALRSIAVGRANWGVIGSEAGGASAAVLYSVVGTCKELGIDPWNYLKEALAGLFALGEKPTDEQLAEWLPDRWLLRRGRDSPAVPAAAG